MFDIGGRQRLPADRPFTAFGFVDAHPGHWPHRLAFDGDDRLGNFLNHALLLLGCENAFDELDIDEGHGPTPSLAMSRDGPMRHHFARRSSGASSGTESGRYRN